MITPSQWRLWLFAAVFKPGQDLVGEREDVLDLDLLVALAEGADELRGRFDGDLAADLAVAVKCGRFARGRAA